MEPSPDHRRAIELREQGRPEEALALYATVVDQYRQAGNVEGQIRALLEQVITRKHQWQAHPDEMLLEAMQADNAAAARLLQEHPADQELQALVALSRAEVALMSNQKEEALAQFGTAVALTSRDNPSFGNRHAHLARVQGQLGDPRAEAELAAAISEIEAARSQLDDLHYRVWLSGAYLGMAELLASKDGDCAQNWLDKARALIVAEPVLPVRKKQLDALQQLLNRDADSS